MFRFRTALLISLLLAGPLVQAGESAGALPALEIESYRLANGLQVILHEDHTIPVAAVSIWYHVGSKDEKPGRTGFAHLFEHMMFQGSAHYDEDYFVPLQNLGGQVNGSTNTDRTNYWEIVPADDLELALSMEADRMGWLLPALTEAKLDNQRDVVKNEKRESDNRPYARAQELLHRMLFEVGHPYRWPVIGSMADLDAASLADVSEFFSRYYAPNNASLCVAGAFDPALVKEWIASSFGPIPPGRPLERTTAWMPSLPTERRTVAEDAVQLPRLYLAWHTPGYYAPGDAEFDLLSDILAGGKTSRLYRKLVYELRIAQDVRAHQSSRELSGVFQIEATAATGHTLAEIEAVIDAELAKLRRKGVTAEEVAMARARYEADFVRGLQRVGGFGGKADRLNRYYTLAGTPDYLQEDLDRFRRADRKSLAAYLRRYLTPQGRAVLHIVPQGELKAAQDQVPVDSRDLSASRAEVVFSPPRIQTAELANGLQILLVEKHELPLVELRLNIKSGWSSDPADRAGTAALTADLLDEGAAGRDALALAGQVARLGARLRTTSTFDASTINLNILRRHLDAGLALMRSVVREPTIAPEDLERVRQSYLGRQKQEAGQPRTQALKEFQRRCFGVGHPYAQPFTGTGTPGSVAALEVADLRRFHADHYRPNNAVLVVVGDLTLEQAVALAQDTFGDWPAAATPAVVPPAIEPYVGPRLVVIDRPGAPQSTIVGGYVSPARNDPDYQALEVVNTAFGGQFSSRINLNLREDKGFTYGVRSELRGFRHGGVFLMAAPVETASTAESVQELLDEMRALRSTRPLQGDELAASLDRLTRGFPRRFETYGSVAAGLSELAQFALPLNTWQAYAAHVGGLEAAAVAGVVQRHMDPDRVIWVIVGDWQVLATQLSGLGLGEIEVLRTP